jgi:anti-sigma factor RsiW
MLQMVLMRARCRRSARVLQSFLDDELDAPTTAKVAEHLEECRRCGLEASAYTAIKAVIAAGDHAHTHRLDPEAVARLDEFARTLANHAPKRRAPTRRRRRGRPR